MAVTVGGQLVSALTCTFSWGLNPGSASITIPGGSSLATGSGFVVNLGSLVFSGVITGNPVSAQGLGGRAVQLQAVDNRIKLMWDDVYGSFNNSEVREDNPATPGIDRQKRFWHVLPDDADAGIKTWTDQPFSAAAIINQLLRAPTVGNAWSTAFHAAQQKPVYNVDFLKGASLGNVLHDISEQQGLVFTLVGDRQLVWARKGEGIVPSIPATSPEWSTGDALSHNDTQIRLMGERNRYQDMPIELEPAWVAAYEKWWIESAWLAEVDGVFGPFGNTVAGAAELKARALSVTLRELVQRSGPTYADYRLWGEVSRMEIPVWTYLQDIVWKAYAVPHGYTVNGIPLHSIEMHEGLLAAVTYSGSGELSVKSPREFYPDDKAFVIVQGQQLSLLDPRSRESIHPDQLEAARTQWSANNRFSLDTRNNLVIFQDAVFVPGAGDSGLFVFPNHKITGLSNTDPLYNIAAPNAKVTVAPARVRAVMVFDAEIFSKRYGSGVRKGPRSVPALNYHALMQGGRFTDEVKYADGKGAEEKAREYGESLLIQQAVYLTGGYKRRGGAGTPLSGVIDRVTVTLSFDGGLEEEVEFTKERGSSNFEHERELDRRQRAKDLFPGQKNLRAEAETLRAIGRASRVISRNPQKTFANLNDVLHTPVAAVHCSPALVESKAALPAGTPLFETDGKEDGQSKRFAGVTIAHGAQGSAVACATQGVIPTLIKGPFKVGDAIGVADVKQASEAEYVGKVGGAKQIGVAMADYTGTGQVLAPMRIGSAGGSAGDQKPWSITQVNEEGSNPPKSHPAILPTSSVWKELNKSLTVDRMDIDLSPAEEGDLIYLEYDAVGGTLELKIGKWDDYPNIFKVDGKGTVQSPYVWRKYYKQLHRCVAPGAGLPYETGVSLNDKTIALQDCDSHLQLVDWFYSGVSVFILVPSNRTPLV